MMDLIVGGSAVLTMLGMVGYTIKMNADNTESRKRIYERLDEVKAKSEQTFTRKDVCAVTHESVNQNLERIDKTMEVGFKELNCKIDKLLHNNGHHKENR